MSPEEVLSAEDDQPPTPAIHEGAARPAPGLGDENLQSPTGEDFSDALTFSFGDLETDTFGVARLGLSGSERRATSGLALLFRGAGVAAVRLESASEISPSSWEQIDVAGIRTGTQRPLQRWYVAFDGGQEGGFHLEFQALGAAATIDPPRAGARIGGMEGYEHLCRVSGTTTVGGETTEIQCLGQRGHSWGSPDWDGMTLMRSVSAWIDHELAIILTAVRPAGAGDHEAEAIEAILIEGAAPMPHRVADPRLSTTYDAEGRHRRAGLELWPHEGSDFPRRAAGELLCGTSLDLGRLRLHSAFFRWHMEGRHGVGRYDIVQRA